VKRKLKTYSKSKRSFQRGGKGIHLNWTLDEFMAVIEKNGSNIVRDGHYLSEFYKISQKKQDKSIPTLYDISEPQTHTSHANAVGISFTKSLVFRVTGGITLKIEIDVNQYRHDLEKLVNAILKKLFSEENEDDVLPSNYLANIASYDRIMVAHNENRKLIQDANRHHRMGGVSGCDANIVSDSDLPRKHCEIEIEMKFTTDAVTIKSIKYTCVNSNVQLWCNNDRLYLESWGERTTGPLTPINRPPKPIEELNKFYNSSGIFHVSVFEFQRNSQGRQNELIVEKDTEFNDSVNFRLIIGFDETSFSSKRDEQRNQVAELIKTNSPTPEEREMKKQQQAKWAAENQD
jgi:hypothetical protein